MIFLKSGFFHQTSPPSPTRDVLEPFQFLANFPGVMYILKRLPGVRDAGESQIPGVPDTGESFFEFSQFFSKPQPIATAFKATINQKTV